MAKFSRGRRADTVGHTKNNGKSAKRWIPPEAPDSPYTAAWQLEPPTFLIVRVDKGVTRIILELRVLPLPRQANRPDRPISLFANDDFRTTLVRGVRVVDFVAIDEQDHVCVLLDGAGFPQVAHHGPF